VTGILVVLAVQELKALAAMALALALAVRVVSLQAALADTVLKHMETRAVLRYVQLCI
jgi:hypothetical protein